MAIFLLQGWVEKWQKFCLIFLYSFLLLSFQLSSSGWAAEKAVTFAIQNSEPKYLLLRNGGTTALSGLCGEIYNHLAATLRQQGYRVEMPLLPKPIKRILADLKSGKAGVFCGAGRNEKREEQYIYSVRPVYETSNILIAHRDEDFIPTSFEDLRKAGVEVGAFVGTTSAQFLKMQQGVLVNDKFSSLEEALTLVATKDRFRFFYYHDLGLVYLVRESHLPLKILPTRFRTVPQWMLYSRVLSPDVVAKIEEELLAMEVSGKLTEIQGRYTASSQ